MNARANSFNFRIISLGKQMSNRCSSWHSDDMYT